MLYILDTDHLSLIQRNGNEGKRILERIAVILDIDIAVSVVTYEEQVRGRLSVISKAKTLEEQVLAYQRLEQLILDYREINIVPFNNAAALEHQRLRKAYPHLGNMDLKIAAITLTQEGILLTRNTSDFGKIEELRIEDWSMI
jgi:tRNA(fMet)-specific endonuclease VapC